MRIAAVVPAFNEQTTIAPVLEVLLSMKQLDEVIVVDDASRDQTAKVSRESGAKVISLARNLGKGGAMKAGAASTTADVLVFIDADLVGLRPHHILDLVNPIIAGEAEMVLGIFSSGRLATDLAQRITPFLSGQRAIKREVFNRIPNIETSRYGVEVAITQYCRAHGVRSKTVPLRELSQVMKEEKRGFLRGFAHRLRMYWEVLKAVRLAKGPDA